MSEDRRSMGEVEGVAAAPHESSSCCARSSREQRLFVEGSGAAGGREGVPDSDPRPPEEERLPCGERQARGAGQQRISYRS